MGKFQSTQLKIGSLFNFKNSKTIGHPIYESHEQIIYIDQVLMPGGPKLTPKDPDDKALMEKWLDSGAMLKDEGTAHYII